MSNKLNCFLDGNELCVVKNDFVNIQESDNVFITLTPEQLEEIQKLGSSNIEELRKELKEAHEQVKKHFSFDGGNPAFFEWKGRQHQILKQLKEIDPNAEEFWEEVTK